LTGERSTDDKGIVRYEWIQTAGRDVTVQDTNDQRLVLGLIDDGSYTFDLVVHDELGQTDRDSVNLVVERG